MRIAISVETNNGLDSAVAFHFGRCPYYAFVDVEENEVQAVEILDSPFFNNHQPNMVPPFIKEHNADVMLSGGMGRRAVSLFQELAIKAATGAEGTIQTALKSYLGGELSVAAPCEEGIMHGKSHD